MDNEIIVLENVSVKINRKFKMGPLSIQIPKGSVVGIIGSNGSGKSVLLSIILGLIKPTTGIVKINTSKIGVALQSPAFYLNKSVNHNINIICHLKNISRKDYKDLVSCLELDKYGNVKFKNLSLGNQKRLEFLNSILGYSDLLILDEPTAYIDEKGVETISNLIKNQINEGKTILITNHSSFDLDSICTHFIQLQDGQLINFSNSKIIVD